MQPGGAFVSMVRTVRPELGAEQGVLSDWLTQRRQRHVHIAACIGRFFLFFLSSFVVINRAQKQIYESPARPLSYRRVTEF